MVDNDEPGCWYSLLVTGRPARCFGRQHTHMPLGTPNDDGRMFAGGDRLGTQRLLAETRRMLENTRTFLKQAANGDDATRLYLEELKGNLENEVRRLENKSLHGDGPPAEPESEPEN
jgi:hypothetical protein